MKIYTPVLSLLLGGLLIYSALAKDGLRATKWLDVAQEQTLVDSVPPPPAIDSAGDKDDYARILAAQQGRTPAIMAECNRDRSFGYALFEDVYGKELTQERTPAFHELMKSVLDLTGVVNRTAKDKFQRLRPYQEHPDTVHALFTVGQSSYPSGHSMASFTLAVVLGAVFPDKKQAFLDRAAQIAQSRVDAGVHNPSDIKEGEVLGKATAAAILANPAFQADLVRVKAELAGLSR